MTNDELFNHCVDRHALFVGIDIIPDEKFHDDLRIMHDKMHLVAPAATHHHLEDGTSIPGAPAERREA